VIYKILNCLQLFNTYDKTQPVLIFCDASGKYGYAAVVVVCNGEMKTLRFRCQESSALAELEALQASLALSMVYLLQGYRVEVRNDNRGIVDSFTRAIAGLPSSAPICRKMVDFVKDRGNILHSKNLKVRWIRGHRGFSLQEISDWLTRYENLDKCIRFDYFDTVKEFGRFIDG
jgi:ribonuclease HI